ncbi:MULTISPECIES: UDP-N-acetylmuramate dehydrogenase [Nocardiopsis]|uniref:UDP-N-acetylenolpyruvoylglucosamine reductase n=1 Tax=Nocardiopsis dassonvillei (strain ATCC 23218 / DSM 43111 / CIP 107115 / JCM 7437 / KCTC 9190 / NBRC 14626 / NCTC 10488 / NRRL B-5397 / IMRU 509) TaxID=446468 RepID=D7B8H7_NOCDD|nr:MULTISPECIES: UDP-N-acetylmuramate dehydrogenase [Nocardiopsis]ADH70485.1 UDP-N-acetylenolpyruvoylglucosamine reductase [Nocardiopsis dassonvillei subsp. dassonvillei DSM 43111]APC33758.1 UDP-N-acetylenolpyruvoylglucosamine reductase [Nocardiopsis dassonvillei]NKY77115.1 UDP-N-acetylmuramate dehydrogenase [Nocardiopsis dassonvillei]VEI91394.1 UDP-N-acetylenolpyruvoylglucosamine reductase [Nocardiopsis dassonvillei]
MTALSEYTTLRLGGPARTFLVAGTTDELVAAVTRADAAGEPVLVLGGGSNLVVSDDGFPGTVVLVDSKGVSFEEAGTDDEGEPVVLLRADAGVEWDPLVERVVAEGLSGLEFLSGIPGRVGSTPIQNVGAYGQDVSQTIREVLVHDRRTGERRRMTNAECGFSYRDSVFKGDDRHVVCEVVFALRRSKLSRPVAYAEVARTLGAEAGTRVPLERARETVLGLRRGKGMVLDPADPDTRSAGSFFTNPVVTAEEFAAVRERAAARLGADVQVPGHPDARGNVKLSAAWLIDRAGFTKGYGDGPARISGKHSLALTNPGGATTKDLLELAREVRAGVEEAFGVRLVNEPVMVGVSL